MADGSKTKLYLSIARYQLELALHDVQPEEEYLCEELEEVLFALRVLQDKVYAEEALLRDRDALQSLFESGIGEHLNGE
jgi:hypothetical protein